MTHKPRPGRPSRAGSAGRPVTIRATDAERANWERCADGASLSEWLRGLANKASDHVRRRRKRCPRCNQLLFAVDGDIETHMEPPSPNGGAPRECIENTAFDSKRRSKP